MNKNLNTSNQAKAAVIDAIQAVADLNNRICFALNSFYCGEADPVGDRFELSFSEGIDTINEGLIDLLQEIAGIDADARINATPAS